MIVVTRTCSQLLLINREANKMNFAQKLKKVADATKGMKGLFQADIIHKEGCPARSTENIISCICDFEVTVKRKNSERGKAKS